MQAIAGPFTRADAAPNQPQGRSGKHCVALMRERSTLEVEMECFGVGPGLSNAIIALAVPAWHRIVHRTANFRNYGKLRSSKIVLRSYGKVTAVTVLRQRTVQSAPYRTPYSAQAWAFAWFWCRHAENGYS